MTTLTPSGNTTLPLKVANTGFLLDRLGQDCHPLQFLRELTQNSIEAILRTGEPGEVVWDVDWNSYQLADLPVFKLSVLDTGDGMTGPELEKYINQLSSSFSAQSVTGNYGVGAKIAAATRNHAGLIYLSWKDGKCSMIHLWRDPTTGQYGLRQFERPDGTFGHYAELEDYVKPDIIGENGTIVVLLGNSEADDTMAAPAGAPSPSRWITKYLNSRYFRFPEGVTVKAREGWMHPRSNTDSNYLRTLQGQESYLSAHAEALGQVELTEAKAHWWILKDEPALTNNSGSLESSGHIAALWSNELYELQSGRGRTARLQSFGVLFGYNRVVIYVEPSAKVGGQIVTTNTARTHLLINQAGLPWDEWAAEFRERMPQQIKDLIEATGTSVNDQDNSRSIRDRLKQIIDLYKVSRYKSAPSGRLKIDDERLVQGGLPGPEEGAPKGPRTRTGTKESEKSGSAGGVYSAFLKPDGAPGTKAKPDPFPEVRWISTEDGTRQAGDLEDRAAKYLWDLNILLINADFRVFGDMINYWSAEFGAGKAARELICSTVHNWFEQSLVEAVVGAKALENSKEWDTDAIRTALSPEGLTSVVLPRYHVYFSIKRELGTRLGKLTQPAT